MNESIGRLYQIASKKEKVIIGLMSGTSLDGLDIALCKIAATGRDTEVELQKFKTVAYPDEVIEKLEKIVSVEQVALQQVCLLNSWLGDYHADLIVETLHDWEIIPADIDCIASHGQTIYHAPVTRHHQEFLPNSTLQIGDGDHIARKTGILTLSDFRQKHTAAGGEGAPMAALADELLFADDSELRLLLNIGGIANFTYLPIDGEAVTTDTGPGNTLIDSIMRKKFNQPFDTDGRVAAAGTVHPKLLKQMLNDDFFSLLFPRTTGPELFNIEWVQEYQRKADSLEMATEDLVATVTWLSAQTIADAIREVCGDDRPEIYVSGGGMHNTQLEEWIEKLLERPLHSFGEIGFDPDAKEAVCFAVMANEALSGRAFSITPKQNAGRRVNFGKISLPV